MESYQLLTITEFAAFFKIKPSCVRRWMRESKVAFVHVGRLVRIPETEIERIIAAGTRHEEWAIANVVKLREAQPQLPDELNDRQQDVCEPLLAIADLVGNGWPTKARAALVELCTGMELPDEATGLQLLADIRDVFSQKKSDRIPTLQLLEQLLTRDESPWNEFDHGRRLSAFQLSKLLRPFEVRPRDIRFYPGVQKGYMRKDFEDPWERYLLPTSLAGGREGQQGQQSSIHAGLGHLLEGQQEPFVAEAKSGLSLVDMRVVADVAPLAPQNGNGAVASLIPCLLHPPECWSLKDDGTWQCRSCNSP